MLAARPSTDGRYTAARQDPEPGEQHATLNYAVSRRMGYGGRCGTEATPYPHFNGGGRRGMTISMRCVVLYAAVITLLCLGQVFLQVETVMFGYRLRDKEKRLAELVDQNRILVYNNTCLKAPQYLASMLVENELEMDVPDIGVVSEVYLERRAPQYAQTP